MARVKGSWLAGKVHGSPCKAEGIYVRTNRTSGEMVAVKLCNPYKGPWTDAQKAHQIEFGNKSKAVNAWINANKPTSTSSGSAEYADFYKKFQRAGKDNSFFAYLCRTLSMSVSGTTATLTNDSGFMAQVTISPTVLESTDTSEEQGEEVTTAYTLTLQANPEEGGSCSCGQSNPIPAGTILQVHASANDGYEFLGWSNGTSDNPTTITMNSDMTLMAIFSAIEYSYLSEE